MSSTEAAAPAPRAGPGAAEYALLAGISLAWGSSFMLTKIAVAVIPPFSLIAARTLIAAVAMLIVMGVKRQRLRLGARDIALFALVGLIANAAPLVLISVSVSYVQSSVTATALALVPLITTLFAVFGGEKITLRSMAGIAVGLVGIVVLFGPESLLALGDSARGLAAALGASIIFAASLFAIALVRHHGPIVVATASLVTAALWTLPLAFVIDGVPAAMPDSTVVASVVVLGLWSTAAATIMLFALLPRAGATFASYNNYLVPAVAVALGTLFLAEPLTAQSVAGVVLVLVGVAISTARRRVPQPPVAPVA